MRSFLFHLVAFALTIVSAGARDALDRPNVIVIFVDDSGYGDYSHTGNPTVLTPNISRMANEGANFTQFYVASPACSASRYSLLTGRYPGRSGLGSWVINPSSKEHLLHNEITIADGLKATGYATGMFGKWHLGNPNAKNGMTLDALPLAHGFGTWLGTNVSHDYDDGKLLKSDPAGNNPISGYTEIAHDIGKNREVCESLTGRYTDAAVDFITTNKERPFFVYFAPNQPHLGLYVSDKFKGTSRRGLFGDVMAEIDASVGRILSTIEEAGIARNTLVIFSSDNGPWIKFQETANDPKYGEARMNIGYALPFRDGKGSNWEGGHRVPGIFYWPGTIAPHTVVEEPASTLDVLPTVLRLCGSEPPKDRTLDGRDIRPYFTAAKSKVAPFEFIYSGPDNQPSAIRVGPWKLHVRLTSQTHNSYGFAASHEKPLLFQVEQDFGERFDRASEHPDTVASMLSQFDAIAASIKTEGTK